MDKRLLNPDFLWNNFEFVQKQASEEGLELVMITSDIPGIGTTYEIIESGD